MIVREIDNIKAKKILFHPEIYGTIFDDNSKPEDNIVLPENSTYIGGFVKGELMAVMVYHKYLDGNKCHVQVLPEYREKHAETFGRLSLVYGENNPLYAEIPMLYKNVLDFAIKNNFKVIKEIDNGYVKNGKKYNVSILKYSKNR